VTVGDGFMIGVGLTRNVIGGEGRVRTTGEIATVGLAVAGGVVVVGLAGVAAIDGLGLGLGVDEGRTRTEADAAGVAVAEIVALVAGLATLVPGVALGAAVDAGLGIVFAVAAGVGLAAGAGAVAAVAAGVAEPVAVDDSSGLTNVFGGALGGGVDSVRIFSRARSAAERSAIVQPLSMFTSITRSLTRRGRGMSRTSVITGAEISSSSPRTVAAVSVFCRRSR
jgi:hypothetical protein